MSDSSCSDSDNDSVSVPEEQKCNNCHNEIYLCSCNNRINNDLYLDIAVLHEDNITPVTVAKTAHIIDLEDIRISQKNFLSIFYPHGENFEIDRNLIKQNGLLNYISFSSDLRKMEYGKFFSLQEQIIENIEKDFNVPRSCFDVNTLVELMKELTNIKTLCDLSCSNNTSSLSWSNVRSLIKDNLYRKDIDCSFKTNIILMVSVIFKNQNKSINPTIIKFNYRLADFRL